MSFIFVLLKFNKYIFISPVMQMKFQAAGAVQVLALRCICHHTLAFKNLIKGASTTMKINSNGWNAMAVQRSSAYC